MKYTLAVFAIVMIIAGCGKGAESGKAFVPGTGHPVNWASHLAIGTPDFHGTFITSVPLEQNAASGAVLFVQHCAPCHGSDAGGKVGPPLLGVLALTPDIPASITAAINVFPIMRGHSVLTQAEILDISSYLTALINGSVPATGVFQTALCYDCHGPAFDGGIAFVSCFSCHNGPDGSIGHPPGWLAGSDSPAAFHGRYGRDLVAGCTTCHGVNLSGGIVVRSASGLAPACSSCHNGTIAPVL